jgi:signal transduction histidine kinase
MMNPELHDMRILIVDDEPVVISLLEDILHGRGYHRVKSITDSRLALTEFQSYQPHLILLDLMMPHLDGFAVLNQLRAAVPADIFLPVLVLTSDVTDEIKIRALTVGATDFLTKPFDLTEVMLRIRNLLQSRRAHDQLADQNRLLDEKVHERTRELRLALAELQVKQQQIVRQERLHALGDMASGIAHDFNNVLALIMGQAELLQQENDSPEREGLSDIITAAQDGAAMIGRLREFSRSREASEPRNAVDLNALILQTVTLTKPKWRDQALGRGVTIRIETELQEIPSIQADATELREVLTNLIFNAVDAFIGDGTITLRTSAMDSLVQVEISDTGSGMSPEVQMRCLEPLFTTKGERGTGMGLALVYGIVQRHGGAIALESEPGKGSTFRIHFPIEADVPFETAVGVPDTTDGALRILAIDSEPVMANLLAERLRSCGHLVNTATSALEALEKVQGNFFDLAITNQAMPEMTGEDLANIIKKSVPKMRIILLTGFDVEHDMPVKNRFVDLVLAKPATLSKLRAAIWTCFNPENRS